MTGIKTDRSEMVTREAILTLLSDDEVASVSTAETAQGLKEGSEYLDLDKLALGVQKVAKASLPMGSVLPRKAVHPDTWKRILAALTNGGQS